MRAALVTDAAALAALESDWWQLFARAPAATPFSSPAWLLPWWDVFAPGALRTVAVRDDVGQLVGLAPLYLEDGLYGRRLLPLGIGLSDHTDILIDPGEREAVGRALTAGIGALSDEWDCWSAEEALPEADVLALPCPEAWSSRVVAASACPVLALQPAVSAVVPAPMRRKWAMARNRTARRDGALRPTTAATLDRDLAALFRLHAARWEERGEAGVLANDSVQRFHEAAAPRLLKAGLLRMETLRFDDAVAGVYYGLHGNGQAFAYLGGFDPAFAFESPGTVLVGAALEQAAADGAAVFSFLRGQEAYKHRWGATDRLSMTRIFEPRR